MKGLSNILAMVGGALAMLAVMLVLQSPGSTSAQAGDHFFTETGHNVPAIFYRYWQTHGGLAQQGYPITDAKMEKNSIDGKEYLTQYFERARFEQHPEFRGTPNEVLLGLLGVEVLKCRPATSGGASAKDAVGTSDFKFIPRPANSYIKSWCIVGVCPETVGAFGGDAPVLDYDQHVLYHLADEGSFDADGLLRFYADTLTKSGWTLGNNVSSGTDKGQIFLPPDNLKDRLQKAAIYFQSNNKECVIAVVRKNPTGNPPDLSLFQGH